MRDDYNFEAIHKLLLAAFTVEELRRFCRDRPLFRPILNNISPDAGLNDIADKVIEYCDKRRCFADLLDETRKVNPRQYARFKSDLRFRHGSTFPVPVPAAIVAMVAVAGIIVISIFIGIRSSSNARATPTALALVTPPTSTPTSSLAPTHTPTATQAATTAPIPSNMPTATPPATPTITNTPTATNTPAPLPTDLSFQNLEENNGTPPGEGNYFWDAWFTTCSFSEPPSPVHEGKQAVRVDAHGQATGGPQDHGGTIGINPSRKDPIDLSPALAISVWVYDTQGDNSIELRLRDVNDCVSNGSWSEEKSHQNQWTRISWPLSAFTEVNTSYSPAGCTTLDKAKIKNIELYEWDDGVYYFDDVTYVPAFRQVLTDLDPSVFQDAVQAEMVMHAPRLRLYYEYPAAISSEILSPGSDDDVGYRIVYSGVTGEEYACWGINLQKGLDFSTWSQLALDIKGKRGDEIVHVWLQSCPPGEARNVAVMDQSADEHSKQRTELPVTTAWQRVQLPLKDFWLQDGKEQTLDLTCIQEIAICFEWGEMEGMIFVDGFAFE